MSHDVIVVGLGAMGLASTWHLARCGARVLGLERFGPEHRRGSSHGESRIIREIYYEGSPYVPMLRRAYELWRELGETVGETLIREVGCLMVGPPDGAVIDGARRTAEEMGIAFEILRSDTIRSRFPAFEPRDDVVGIHDPRGGWLRADACLRAMRRRAEGYGAELRFGEPAEGWSPDGEGVLVRTPGGAFRADRLVIAAGPWISSLVPDLDLPLAVERQVLWWFQPSGAPSALRPDRCPVFLAESPVMESATASSGGGRFFYGFPLLESGVKASIFHAGEMYGRPEEVRREVDPREVTPLREALASLVPAANGEVLNQRVCLFTNTPDHHFLVDFHPEHPQALLCSPCSGHGFKFASVIGEIVADLLLEGEARLELEPFRLGRVMVP